MEEVFKNYFICLNCSNSDQNLYFCLNKTCFSPKILCKNCIFQHSDHENDLLNLIDFLKASNLTNYQQNLIEEKLKISCPLLFDENENKSKIKETLNNEFKKIDEIMNTLLRNVRIQIEKLKIDLKNNFIEKRYQQFLNIIQPIKKDFLNHFSSIEINNFFKNLSKTILKNSKKQHSENLISHLQTYFQKQKKIDFSIIDKISDFFQNYTNNKYNFSFDSLVIDSNKFQLKQSELLSKFQLSNLEEIINIKQSYPKNIPKISLKNLDKITSIKTIKKAHNMFLNSLNFFPIEKNHWQEEVSTQKILISSDINSEIIFWNPDSGKNYDIINNVHSRSINCIKILQIKYPKINEPKFLIVSGGDDSFLKFSNWDFLNFGLKFEISTGNDLVNFIEILESFEENEENKIITAGLKNFVKIWDWRKKKCIKEIEICGRFSTINLILSFNYEKNKFMEIEEKSFFLSVSNSNIIKLWDYKRKNSFISQLKMINNDKITSITVIKQNIKNYLSVLKKNNCKIFYVIGFFNGNINIFNFKGDLIRNIENAHSDSIITLSSIFVKKKGMVLISSGLDKNIKFWDWKTGQIIKVLSCSHKIQNCYSFFIDNYFFKDEEKEKIIMISGGKSIKEMAEIIIWGY